jgi:hypothetical protein
MDTLTSTDQTPGALYHYTTRDRIEEVLADIEGPGVYVEVSDGLYGPGFYALDLGPDDDDLEGLRWECFEDSRSAHPMDGVLVLDPRLAEPGFFYQYRHIWLLPIDPGSERPPSIDHMITAVGTYEGHRDWEFTDLS